LDDGWHRFGENSEIADEHGEADWDAFQNVPASLFAASSGEARRRKPVNKNGLQQSDVAAQGREWGILNSRCANF
jgi:hypothetical protein